MGPDIENQTSAIVAESSSSNLHNNCKFTWRDISCSVESKVGTKRILQNVSGYVEKGIFPMAYRLYRYVARRYGPVWFWENDAS